MITVTSDGALIWNSTDDEALKRDALELPADLLAQQSDLIDRVLAFAFDVLGMHTLDLRIRPYTVPTRGTDGSDNT
jgi:hypothetical protein